MPTPRDLLLHAANLGASAIDLLSDLKKGKDPVDATLSALLAVRRRARALERVNGRASRAARAGHAEPVTYVEQGKRHWLCPHCGSEDNLHYIGKRCIGCDSCIEEAEVIPQKPLFVLCPCGCGLPQGQCMGKSAGGKR